MKPVETERKIEIDQQQWRAIPAELSDGLDQRPLSKRQQRTWSLVLQARRIPCRQEQTPQRRLLVPVASYHQACEELRQFEAENRNWPPPLPKQRPQLENTVATIWVLIGLGLFHIFTQQPTRLAGIGPVDWVGIGNAAAGKILDGELWRLLTALTLHSGGIHLASNLVIGGIFVARLCRDLGSGAGWSLVLASGALGNLLNAFFQSPTHRSIGASTAVFGAVGLLAAINMLRFRHNLRRRWPLPVAAACGLLALLGAGGENVDIGAHLFGFVCGLGLGLLAEHLREQLTRSNRLLQVLAAASVLLSWWAAIALGG